MSDCRTAYPAVYIKTSLNSSGTLVQYTINGEVGYVGNGFKTHEDVAKTFLEPFFEF